MAQTIILTGMNVDLSANDTNALDDQYTDYPPSFWTSQEIGGGNVRLVDFDDTDGSVDAAILLSVTSNPADFAAVSLEFAETVDTSWQSLSLSFDFARYTFLTNTNRARLYVDMNDDGIYTAGVDILIHSQGLAPLEALTARSTVGSSTDIEIGYTITADLSTLDQATRDALNGRQISVEFSIDSGGQPTTIWAVDNIQLSAVVCFAQGTRLRAEGGDRTVESLLPGDLIWTADHGLQPVRWIASRRLSALDLLLRPQLRPIRIPAGALGAGVPRRDLLVSPQHRILIRSRIAERVCGSPEVLVAAKRLVGIGGIDAAAGLAGVVYFHILLDRHELVLSEAALSESLFPGPQAEAALAITDWDEIVRLFPSLATSRPPPARPLAEGKSARQIAMRHHKHGKPLFTPPCQAERHQGGRRPHEAVGGKR